MIQERGARTRALVLAAAAEEFSARGYCSTTLLDVVNRSGMSKGALYGHFASKEDLAEALILEAGDKLVARIGRSAGRVPTAVQALQETILDLTRHLRRDAPARSALRLAIEVPHLDRSAPGLVERIALSLTPAIVRAQAHERSIARYPSPAIARILMSVFLAIPYPPSHDDADAARLFNSLWDAVSGSSRGDAPPTA